MRYGKSSFIWFIVVDHTASCTIPMPEIAKTSVVPLLEFWSVGNWFISSCEKQGMDSEIIANM